MEELRPTFTEDEIKSAAEAVLDAQDDPEEFSKRQAQFRARFNLKAESAELMLDRYRVRRNLGKGVAG